MPIIKILSFNNPPLPNHAYGDVDTYLVALVENQPSPGFTVVQVMPVTIDARSVHFDPIPGSQAQVLNTIKGRVQSNHPQATALWRDPSSDPRFAAMLAVWR